MMSPTPIVYEAPEYPRFFAYYGREELQAAVRPYFTLLEDDHQRGQGVGYILFALQAKDRSVQSQRPQDQPENPMQEIALGAQATSLESVSTPQPAAQWSARTMLGVRPIRDVQVSPNSRDVLFTSVEASLDKDAFISQIYRTSISSQTPPQRIGHTELSCNLPRWSPDGRWIAFIAEENKKKSLRILSADGHDIQVLVQAPKEVQNYVWSPDSRSIAFVMAEEVKTESPMCDAYDYARDKEVNRLWVVSITQPGHYRALTPPEYFVKGAGDFGSYHEEFDWSPDGREVAFTYTPGSGLNHHYVHNKVARVEVETGRLIPLDERFAFALYPRYSRDGRWLALMVRIGDTLFARELRIAVLGIATDEMRLLSSTWNNGPFFQEPSLLGWTPDSREVLLFEPSKTKFHLVALSLDGGSRTVDMGDGYYHLPALNTSGTTMGFVQQAPGVAPEAYVTNLAAFQPAQVSALNASYRTYPNGKTEVITWHSFDGTEIEGLLTYPVGYKEGSRYPLLLYIHGGPAGVFNEQYLGLPWPYPLAAFAEEGYAILRPNPRGSTGYGTAFRQANLSDWGGGDYQDIMTGVDTVIARGVADPDRLGVFGWSYGGYMTAWIITHSDRFKAASMGAGVTNLISMMGTSDLTDFMTDYLQRDYCADQDMYCQLSPITHAAKAQTPLLIQHGLNDLRIPVAQAYEFYHALRRNGQEPTLIVYPRMGHRFPEPKMTYDLLERNLQWFRKHLKP